LGSVIALPLAARTISMVRDRVEISANARSTYIAS